MGRAKKRKQLNYNLGKTKEKKSSQAINNDCDTMFFVHYSGKPPTEEQLKGFVIQKTRLYSAEEFPQELLENGLSNSNSFSQTLEDVKEDCLFNGNLSLTVHCTIAVSAKSSTT